MPWIRALEGNRESYRREDLPRLFGEDTEKAVSTLQAIGILQYDHKKASYRVAKLYGPGLQVYATRARRVAGDPTSSTE